MSDLRELRANIRPLAAAALGTGSGLGLMSYTTTLFGPHLVSAFGWSLRQFAWITLSVAAALIAMPLVGILTDRFGARRSALIGAIGIPFSLCCYSFMTGNFAVYFAISCTILVLGSFTTPVVYSRLIAADFHKSRGLALTIVTIAPAVVSLAVAPALTWVISEWGWRAGYRALAAFVLVSGLVAIALLKDAPHHATFKPASPATTSKSDFGLIMTSGPFWIMTTAMFLCCLSTALHSSQMGVMLKSNHLNSAGITSIIMVYIVGTICGRLACGLALDRFSAAKVAAISMFPPAIGFALLASPWDHIGVISFAMFTVGLAVGAEGDLPSFLVARHFALRMFSRTLSLIMCGVLAASVAGGLLISVTLKLTNDDFAPFLYAMAVAVALGSLLFLWLPKDAKIAKDGN